MLTAENGDNLSFIYQFCVVNMTLAISLKPRNVSKLFKVTHKYGDLADLNGKVFAFGGYRSFETEIYHQDNDSWTLYKEIPFRDFGEDKPYFYHMTVGRLSTQVSTGLVLD